MDDWHNFHKYQRYELITLHLIMARPKHGALPAPPVSGTSFQCLFQPVSDQNPMRKQLLDIPLRGAPAGFCAVVGGSVQAGQALFFADQSWIPPCKYYMWFIFPPHSTSFFSLRICLFSRV